MSSQFVLLLIFGGIAFISWLFGKLKEQAEINRARQQSRRQYEESLRTGRSEGEPATATSQSTQTGMSQDLRTLAQRRQEQLRALREQQAERMRRGGAGRFQTTAGAPDPTAWSGGQTTPQQPARRPTPPPPIRRQPQQRVPQQRSRQPQIRQPQQTTQQTRAPQPPQRRTAVPPPPPTRTRHERGQRIIEVERTPSSRKPARTRELSGTRSLLVPFSQEAMSASAHQTRKRSARFSHADLRRAVIMFEVFNKPVCMRDPDESPGAFPSL